MSVRHCGNAVGCLCALQPLCHCVIVLLRNCVSAPLCHCAIVGNVVRLVVRITATVPLCLCLPVDCAHCSCVSAPLCQCRPVDCAHCSSCVNVQLRQCVSAPLRHYASAPLYHYAIVSMWSDWLCALQPLCRSHCAIALLCALHNTMVQ